MQKTQKSGFGIVGIIIIAAVAVLGVFFGYQYLKLQKIQEGAKAPAVEPSVTPSAQIQPPTTEIDISNWKTYVEENWHFILKYPSALKAACPAYPSCYLGSLQLNPERYYSSKEMLPAGSMIIAIGSYGVESDPPITDIRQWRKRGLTGRNEEGEYKDIIVGKGNYRALEERTRDENIVYVSTGTGRLLAFTLLPRQPEYEKLFNLILETIALAQ